MTHVIVPINDNSHHHHLKDLSSSSSSKVLTEELTCSICLECMESIECIDEMSTHGSSSHCPNSPRLQNSSSESGSLKLPCGHTFCRQCIRAWSYKQHIYRENSQNSQNNHVYRLIPHDFGGGYDDVPKDHVLTCPNCRLEVHSAYLDTSYKGGGSHNNTNNTSNIAYAYAYFNVNVRRRPHSPPMHSADATTIIADDDDAMQQHDDQTTNNNQQHHHLASSSFMPIILMLKWCFFGTCCSSDEVDGDH